jgi:branched-chain amino acid transport system ATP-binding protein
MAGVLDITGLHKRFGGIVVAEDVALSVAPKQILGLIGPNGAGKTSLFNLIAGVVRADAGEIRLNGARIDRMAVYDRARTGLSRTWQHIRLFPSLTILENLLVAPRQSPDETPLASVFPGTAEKRREVEARAMAQLEKVKMVDAAGRYPSELSYGKQKLISIARALMNDGNCLLLDEPMAGVEGPAYDAIKDLVRGEAEAGRAVCVVEHNISFIRDLCDSAVFMFNGRIMARGTVEDLVRNPDLTELYFGT